MKRKFKVRERHLLSPKNHCKDQSVYMGASWCSMIVWSPGSYLKDRLSLFEYARKTLDICPINPKPAWDYLGDAKVCRSIRDDWVWMLINGLWAPSLSGSYSCQAPERKKWNLPRIPYHY